MDGRLYYLLEKLPMNTRDTATPRDPFQIAQRVSRRLEHVQFEHKVTLTYNPLDYAWAVREAYLRRFGTRRKRTLFLGMNPGPWGMAQTGVPFSDTTIAGDWMGFRGLAVGRPENEHPKRPVLGWELDRAEGSGQRLLGFLREQMGSLEAFFENNFVFNYLPLVMYDADGRNITPARLLKVDRLKIFEACDPYLQEMVAYYQPEVLVGIGKFALRRLEANFDGSDRKIIDIPHPSPASPIATRDGGRYWKRLVTETLTDAGVLKSI